MSATCVLSGAIVSPAGSALSGALVTFKLIGGTRHYYTESGKLLTRTALSATSDGAGAFSVTVDRNDLLTPSGSRWKVDCVNAQFQKHVNVNTDSPINVITATESPP